MLITRRHAVYSIMPCPSLKKGNRYQDDGLEHACSLIHLPAAERKTSHLMEGRLDLGSEAHGPRRVSRLSQVDAAAVRLCVAARHRHLVAHVGLVDVLRPLQVLERCVHLCCGNDSGLRARRQDAGRAGASQMRTRSSHCRIDSRTAACRATQHFF